MKKIKNLSLIAAAAAGAGMGACAVSAAILYKKTIPRPKGVDMAIVDEFADKEKFEEYMEKLAPIANWLEEQSLEEIDIEARDGINLHGYYLAAENNSEEEPGKKLGKEPGKEPGEEAGKEPGENLGLKSDMRSGRKLAILHHGFTSTAQDNMVHAKFFHDEGYDVLLLDLRAHGKSGGKYVGFGILDRYDTLEWIRYCVKRFGEDVKIVLFGVSMGATTSLMTLEFEEAQKYVFAVVADCAFTSPGEIFGHVISTKYHLPAKPVIKLNGLYSRRVAGYTFDEFSTREALAGNQVPVLLIHGQKDKFVPLWMAEDNLNACCSKKELLVVPEAGHGSSVFEDPDLYQDAESRFLREALEEEAERA